MVEIDAALRYVAECTGSDLHLKVGSPPIARIDGKLAPFEGHEPLAPDDTESALRSILTDEGLLHEFAEVGEADFSYELAGTARFRVNAFRQRGSVSIACRMIPLQVRTIDDLGLPAVITRLAEEQRGLILLTGTTGSGKSTTLAAMIDHINSTRARHIITLEDPIEYLHRDKVSIINQREVGSDTESFARAMRRVLRQDPDVILIGEMRDEETVRTALSAAETGHLVLSTLHTLDATETINRIIDFFPPHLQQQARVMLASTLRGAVSQRLVPAATGTGRVAVAEVLVSTGRVQDLILNANETGRIREVTAEGDFYGMQTFDQALLGYVMEGRITEAAAFDAATNPHDLRLMLDSKGHRASDLEQLTPADQNGHGNGLAPATGPPAEADPPAHPPAEAAPVTQMPAEEAPVIHMPAEDAPATHPPSDGAPAAHVPAEATPVAHMPAEATPGIRMPAEEGPATHPPAETGPAIRMPAAEAPAAHPPVETGSGIRMPGEEAPTTHPPAETGPAIRMPAAEAPAAHPPVETGPGIRMPGEEAPTAHPPADEAPPAHTPSEAPPGIRMPAEEAPTTRPPAAG